MRTLITILWVIFYTVVYFDLAWPQTPTQTATFVLTWQDNSGNNPKVNDQEDGFRIERRLGQTGTPGLINTTAPNAITYSDVILKDDGANEYCYQVEAFNKVGVSAKSNMACASTPRIDTGPIAPVIKSITVTVTINL